MVPVAIMIRTQIRFLREVVLGAWMIPVSEPHKGVDVECLGMSLDKSRWVSVGGPAQSAGFTDTTASSPGTCFQGLQKASVDL